MTGWSYKRIQHEAHKRAWEGFGDEDRYHPLRDGKRQYAAKWVIYRMANYLSPDQITMGVRLAMLSGRAQQGGFALSGEMIGYIASEYDEMAHQIGQIESGEAYRMLAGFEQAALHRVGTDGRHCFHGIIEGDGQTELARRAGIPEGSVRSLRSLVQMTMDRLGLYAEENKIDLANWNRAA